MYGLLKSCTCSNPRDEREARRLAYCGTCKTLGTLFGHKSRLLLNHDIVFLAELLLALRGGTARTRLESVDGELLPPKSSDDAFVELEERRDQSVKKAKPSPAYRSYHCMALPELADIPLELEIAASMNVLLTEFKVRDQLIDAPGLKWKIANRIFSGDFASAARILEKHDFPLSEAFEWLSKQVRIERIADRKGVEDHHRENFEPFSDGISRGERRRAPFDFGLLHKLCEPTAMVTGLFFQQAGNASRRNSSREVTRAARSADLRLDGSGIVDQWLPATQLAGGHDGECLFEIGFNFGCLVYILDALEDYDEDQKKGQFNALSSCFSLERGPLTVAAKTGAIAEIKIHLGRIIRAIEQLPLDETARGRFISRFRSNTQARLRKFSQRTERAGSCKSGSSPRCAAGTIYSITKRKAAGTELVERIVIASPKRFDAVRRFSLSIYCFLFAFLFPRASEAVESVNDCLEMPFNLIFLSSAVGSLVTDVLYPFRLLAVGLGGPAPGPAGPIPGMPGGVNVEEIEERRRKGEGCCNNCSDCCDCGDCDCCGCGCADSSCCDGKSCDWNSCDCGHCCHGCDCSGCDCSGCDCSGCDCGGCDCNC